jgi:predicted lipid-binding transport protein (Tim44 family)
VVAAVFAAVVSAGFAIAVLVAGVSVGLALAVLVAGVGVGFAIAVFIGVFAGLEDVVVVVIVFFGSGFFVFVFTRGAASGSGAAAVSSERSSSCARYERAGAGSRGARPDAKKSAKAGSGKGRTCSPNASKSEPTSVKCFDRCKATECS